MNRLTLFARIGWPRRLRNLHADAPGKRAYVRPMHDVYRGHISVSTQSMACSLIRSTLCKQPRTGDYTSTFLMGMKLVTMWSSSKRSLQSTTKRHEMQFFDTIRIINLLVIKSMPTPILWTQCYRLQANSPISYFIRCMRDTRCRNQV